MRRVQPIALALLVGASACMPPRDAATSPTPTASESPAPASASPSSSPAPGIDMTAALLAKALPYNDGFALTRAIRGRDGTPAKGFEPVRTTPPVEDVGTQRDFYTYDYNVKKFLSKPATLRLITEHVKWWVGNDVILDMVGLRRTATSFETQIYPTDRRLYGDEWSPGIDADPRINMIYARIPGSAAGYFNGADEEPRWVNEFSSEREAMYINALAYRLGSAQLDVVLAHEFCHMIQFNTRRRSAVWFNEGQAQLCERDNGFNPAYAASYMREPDTQLSDWTELGAAGANYGLAYAFLEFMRQHAGGVDLIRTMMQKGIDTPEDLDAVLKQRGQTGIEELFANFVAANAFIGTAADRQFSYPGGAVAPQPPTILPADRSVIGTPLNSSVHNYAARYIELPRGRIRVAFEGATTNRLMPTEPHSGRYVWWSDKGDGMDSTLTKKLDLRSANNPKLTFWTWFETEADYDYAYVTVSTDGNRWIPLRTEASSDTDPNGTNLGNGMTGGSSGHTALGWRQLNADLSAYAGKEIDLRFQYVTDGNLNLAGFAVDDIEITGLPLDDAETDNGWTASGFIRSTNIVAQRHMLQILRFGDRGSVERQAIGNGRATFELDTSGDRRPPILAVTGFAVRTTQPTSFTVTVESR